MLLTNPRELFNGLCGYVFPITVSLTAILASTVLVSGGPGLLDMRKSQGRTLMNATGALIKAATKISVLHEMGRQLSREGGHTQTGKLPESLRCVKPLRGGLF